MATSDKAKKAFVDSLVKAELITSVARSKSFYGEDAVDLKDLFMKKIKDKADAFIYKGEKVNYWDLETSMEWSYGSQLIVRFLD